jgi:hypothetical protein
MSIELVSTACPDHANPQLQRERLRIDAALKPQPLAPKLAGAALCCFETSMR